MSTQSSQSEVKPAGRLARGLRYVRAVAIQVLFGGEFVDGFISQRRALESQWRVSAAMRNMGSAQGNLLLSLADRAEAQLIRHAQFIKLACEHFDALDRGEWQAESSGLAAQRKELLDELAAELSASDGLRSQLEQLKETLRGLEQPPQMPPEG